jgi:ribosomal protein S18 acetylase RimI-like enzyme
MGALKDPGQPAGVGWLRVRLDRVTPSDWSELRSVRLRALADAPTAFISEPDREADWQEDDWRSVIEQARWVVARTAHGVVGVARSKQDPESPQRRFIEAVWVEPEFRRLGVGHRLVRWLIDSELRSGIKEILLWVIVGNAHARSFYVSLGFRPTGRRQPVPGPENRTEELLAYVIDRLGFRPG